MLWFWLNDTQSKSAHNSLVIKNLEHTLTYAYFVLLFETRGTLAGETSHVVLAISVDITAFVRSAHTFVYVLTFPSLFIIAVPTLACMVGANSASWAVYVTSAVNAAICLKGRIRNSSKKGINSLIMRTLVTVLA